VTQKELVQPGTGEDRKKGGKRWNKKSKRKEGKYWRLFIH
jgi:hypothetical protein